MAPGSSTGMAVSRSSRGLLSLGTGIAVSEEIADTDSVGSAAKSVEVKAPKDVPFGGK